MRRIPISWRDSDVGTILVPENFRSPIANLRLQPRLAASAAALLLAGCATTNHCSIDDAGGYERCRGENP